MSFYRGRSARISTARMIVREVIKRSKSCDISFTCREFYVKHKTELDSRISEHVPRVPVEAMVKGALRGLSNKGLLEVHKAPGISRVTCSRNVYATEPKLLGLTHGQAVVEAQRRRISSTDYANFFHQWHDTQWSFSTSIRGGASLLQISVA